MDTPFHMNTVLAKGEEETEYCELAVTASDSQSHFEGLESLQILCQTWFAPRWNRTNNRVIKSHWL
jgi:hypothetical protein